MIDLEDLEDLFEDLGLDGPSDHQLSELYKIFLRDFLIDPIFIKGLKLKFNNNKSIHPICKGKAQTFEHIITRESKHSKKRNFDPERANKIHWIKPIIESVPNVRIKYFEDINHENQNQLFYWFEEKNFIIIIREIRRDYLLITAFSIDKTERSSYKNQYEKYKSR